MSEYSEQHVDPVAIWGTWGTVAAALLVGLGPRLEGMPPEAQRLAAVTVLMAGLWVFQAIPIAVTSLLPLALYPVLGIQSAKAVSKSYIDDNVFLYLGGFIIAIGIERWNLHRRMALHTVNWLGFGPRRLVFGLMFATAALSMWISNTATTMLMLPIALALVTAIEDACRHGEAGDGSHDPRSPGMTRLATALLLGIAYASTIGGLATRVGTPTNTVFFGFWERHEALQQAPPLSTASWMAAIVPLAVVLLAIAGIVLTWRLPPLPGAERIGQTFFRDRLEELGTPSAAERRMFVIFAITAILWITRTSIEFSDTVAFPGWGAALERLLVARLGFPAENVAGIVNDSTVAIFMALLTFLIPAGRGREGQRLLDWNTAEKRLPWGVILLFGAGFALADAFTATGLSRWVGEGFADWFRGAPPVVLVFGLCAIVVFLTEFTSNVATISTLLPILTAVALSLRIDPRLLLIPATIAASCGFMLPVGTPPNAIVFGTGRIAIGDMVRRGLLLNLISIVLVTLATFTLLVPAMGVQTSGTPEWLSVE